MTNAILTVETLIARMNAGFTPDFLFFWGHTPRSEGKVEKQCLSQWWLGSPFTLDGVRYRTAEHYMMAEKARLFGDEAALQKILAADGPDEAKDLGRDVRGYDEVVWKEHRTDIVMQGNLAKFGQDGALKAFLLATGEQVLVEASPYDTIWGIGLRADSAEAAWPQSWRGLNLLGFILMQVREQLRGR
jgi:ribA/ribD-fused uncharacterized protein